MGNPSVNTSRIERAPDASLPSAAEQRAARLASGHVVIVCGGRDYADWERVYSNDGYEGESCVQAFVQSQLYLPFRFLQVHYLHPSTSQVRPMATEKNGKRAGGLARALALTPERRKEISDKGVLARQERASLPRAVCGDDARPIVIGDIELQCYVLEDETRVLSLRGLQGGIGLSIGGGREGVRKIPALMARLNEKGLDIMGLDARANAPIKFLTTTGVVADGYDATILPDICAVLIQASRKGLLDKRLEKLGERAALLQHGFATLGIIGLVDRVTGYRDLKSATEFSRLVEAYVAKALQPYVSKFTPDYYSEICRLRGLPFDPSSVKRPAYFGHLTNDIVYRRMAPGIWKELKARASKEEKIARPHLHRYLTLDIGDPRLKEVIVKVVTTMQLSNDWPDFKMKLDRILPPFNETMQLPLALQTDNGIGL